MLNKDAVGRIMKLVGSYDNGNLTWSRLEDLVRETIDDVSNTSFEQGLAGDDEGATAGLHPSDDPVITIELEEIADDYDDEFMGYDDPDWR